MDFAFIHATVIIENSTIEDGAVIIKNGVIAWVGATSSLPYKPKRILDLGGFILSPGFIDIHVHGGGGFDSTVSNPQSLKTIFRSHEPYGTTSLCLAIVSQPLDKTQSTLQSIANLAVEGTEGARLLGAYLEGPFLNPNRCGAHSLENLIQPNFDTLSKLAAASNGWLRIITIAPELPGADQLIGPLAQSGIIVAIGHTDSDYAQTYKAIQSGCRLVTHLFNAMKPFHHREASGISAIFESSQIFSELIVDDSHLHPSTVRLAYRCLGPERICLVTDSTAVMGSPDGKGLLGSIPIFQKDRAAFLENGTLAGTSLNMIQAVKNLMYFCQLDLPSAIHCASMVPAKLMGISDRLGSITPGKYADVIILNPSNLQVVEGYVGGMRIYCHSTDKIVP